MKTTIRINNYKNFETELKVISSIDNLNKTNIILDKDDLFSTSGLISKKGKELIIEIKKNDFEFINKIESVNKFEAQIGVSNFIIDAFSINDNTICSLNILKSKNFNTDQKAKYKNFISTEISKLKTFHFQFETVTYQDDKVDHFYDCIRFKIGNLQYDLTQLKMNDKGYYIIENFDKIDFADFCNHCFSIKQALGFITAFMPGGEEYYFSEEQNYFYCNYNRPQIDSMYQPLNWNPYWILSDKKDIAEGFMGKLNCLTSNIFSNLATKISESKTFSSLIILLLEASSVRSFLLIPSAFSVIVEALSKIISENEKGKELPINDIVLAKKIKNELIALIESYNEEISEDGILKLKRRLNDINKPIVKEHLTNNEKLTLPFEQLGIKLSINDINIIEHRNDLLHGNILLLNEEHKTEKELNNYIGYVSSKLYTLISALILKYVGYEGYIINHAKFYEDLCKIKTDEDYYRLI